MIYVNTEEIKVNGQVAEKAQEKKMLWDEENRLGAIDINGYVSNYTRSLGYVDNDSAEILSVPAKRIDKE